MRKIAICIFYFSLLVNLSGFANTAHTGIRGLIALQITADMGAGINLYNTMDAPTETLWGNPITTLALITSWKEKGFKTLRLPVTWNNHLGPAPDYKIDPTWLARVETIANYAFTNDMYVIINAHHEEWYQPTAANETIGKDKMTKVWTQIANKFKDYGDYLIFETMNEPRVFGAPDEWSGGNKGSRIIINSFNLAAVNAIRNAGENNIKRCIMTPTYAASAASAVINDYVVPNNDSLVIVSLHNYSPFSFCLDNPGTSTWGSASDKSQLNSEFDLIYNKFIKNGRAVVLGEWGAGNKNNTPALVTYYDFYTNAAKSRQMAPIVWIFHHNRNTLTWDIPAIADVMVDPYKSGYVAVKGVSLSSTSASIKIQDAVQLSVNILPTDALNKSVIWSSSNTTVASVSSTGLIIGKAKGLATITVTTNNGGFRTTFALTVTNINVSSISIIPIADTINVNENLQINPFVLPSNATVKTIVWTSSNDAVASVNSAGLVTGKSKGTTTITATTIDGGKSSTCTIEVSDIVNSIINQPTLNNIEIYPNPLFGNQLTIKLCNYEEKTTIRIMNVNGQNFMEYSTINKTLVQLDLNLKPDIYFVQITNKKATIVKKLIVKK